jgi:hypothetical protein
VQDVPGYLQRGGLKYACYMDPDSQAIVDGTFAYRVNYETYLFADTTARQCFSGDAVTR